MPFYKPQNLDVMSLVKETDDCITWPYGRDANKYGQVVENGRKLKVHRLVAFKVGKLESLDSELKVLHKCDNPPCFNPRHLFIGTQYDNIMDMHKKKRGWREKITHCPRGHEYNEQNTIKYNKSRYCRTCNNARRKPRKSQVCQD